MVHCNLGRTHPVAPTRKVDAVTLLQLAILAVVAMVGLVALRLVRIHLGRTPLPEGRGRRLFLLGFLIVPPLVLGALTTDGVATAPLRAAGNLPAYVAITAGLVILMSMVAMFLGQVTHGRSGRIVRLGLVGNAGDPHDMPSNPPMTAPLAESIAIVDQANGVFPRGPEFVAQIARSGFRDDWEALDRATRTLEGQIAEDRRLGLGVAEAATVTAWDARTRLDTLLGLAAAAGDARLTT